MYLLLSTPFYCKTTTYWPTVSQPWLLITVSAQFPLNKVQWEDKCSPLLLCPIRNHHRLRTQFLTLCLSLWSLAWTLKTWLLDFWTILQAFIFVRIHNGGTGYWANCATKILSSTTEGKGKTHSEVPWLDKLQKNTQFNLLMLPWFLNLLITSKPNKVHDMPLWGHFQFSISN